MDYLKIKETHKKIQKLAKDKDIYKGYTEDKEFIRHWNVFYHLIRGRKLENLEDPKTLRTIINISYVNNFCEIFNIESMEESLFSCHGDKVWNDVIWKYNYSSSKVASLINLEDV